MKPGALVTDTVYDEITCCYGFERIENLHWIRSDELCAIGRLRTDVQEFIVRLYKACSLCEPWTSSYGSGKDLAIYHTEFICWLESACVNVEHLIRTKSEVAYAFLSTGEIVTLFICYTDPSIPLPLGADDVRAWGRFVARMHAACERWHPSVQVKVRLLKMSPEVTLNRAMSFAAKLPKSRNILEKFGPDIVFGCQRLLDIEEFQPVHGDLWPGNLLKGPDGLRAIDFLESGDGPRAVDMATAFRWICGEYKEYTDLLWQAWLSGYSEICKPSALEIDSAPALACLQSLYWLIFETSEALKEGAETEGWSSPSFYVEDHCSTIETLLLNARHLGIW